MANLGASTGWGLVVGREPAWPAPSSPRRSDLPSRVAATITAFGGGTLLAAVALQLVPAADKGAGPGLTALGLAAGTLAYVGADAWLTRDPGMKEMRRRASRWSPGAPMPMADEAQEGEVVAAGIFVDGVPESLALGLTVAGGGIGVALLVGVLVGNVVEAYGSAHLIVDGGPAAAVRDHPADRHRAGARLRDRPRRHRPRRREPQADRHRPGRLGRRGPGRGLDRDHPAHLRRGEQAGGARDDGRASSAATC